jgi:hypothetical protein
MIRIGTIKLMVIMFTPSIEKTPEQIKLESEYKSNKDAIDKQAAIQLTGNLTDEEKNIEFQKVWGDFKFE